MTTFSARHVRAVLFVMAAGISETGGLDYAFTQLLGTPDTTSGAVLSLKKLDSHCSIDRRLYSFCVVSAAQMMGAQVIPTRRTHIPTIIPEQASFICRVHPKPAHVCCGFSQTLDCCGASMWRAPSCFGFFTELSLNPPSFV